MDGTFITVNGDCYEWAGSTFQSGYGRIKTGGRTYRAHRVAWELAHGPIPAGRVVMHTCDNRLCVRVSHLVLGSNEENMADMVKKGRSPAGERNARAKLSDAQAAEILDLYKAGDWTQAQIADRFGITQTQVSWILRRSGNGPGKGAHTKLSDAQIAEMRARYEAGGTNQVILAQEFGVSSGLVSLIVRGLYR